MSTFPDLRVTESILEHVRNTQLYRTPEVQLAFTELSNLIARCQAAEQRVAEARDGTRDMPMQDVAASCRRVADYLLHSCVHELDTEWETDRRRVYRILRMLGACA